MKTMIDKVLLPVHFVRALVGWWRAPEPREAYDIDAEVERDPAPQGPGHRALHGLPLVPNSKRRFAYRYATPSGIVTEPHPLQPDALPLFYDPQNDIQTPYVREWNGTPLYL